MKKVESLRDYTNEDLYDFMKNNMNIDVTRLSCFSSEILLRMIEGTWELQKKDLEKKDAVDKREKEVT